MSISKKTDKKSWWKPGLVWGLFMFVTMSVVYPYFAGDTITPLTLLFGAVLWALAGLGFGYTTKRFQKRTH